MKVKVAISKRVQLDCMGNFIVQYKQQAADLKMQKIKSDKKKAKSRRFHRFKRKKRGKT